MIGGLDAANDPDGPQEATMSEAAFVEWYAAYRGDYRYELSGGVPAVIDIAGASSVHVRLVGEIVAALRPLARRAGCDVASSDQAVLPAPGKVYFPDVVVTCDETDLVIDDVRPWRSPRVVIEVLSASTQGADMTRKRADYVAMGAEYVMFSSLERVAYRGRHDRIDIIGATGGIELSIGTMDVGAIYDAARFPA